MNDKDRERIIKRGNNAPREFKGKRKGMSDGEFLSSLRDRLLVGPVSWEELRRRVWAGDRYRMRHFRGLLVSANAIHVSKDGNAEIIDAGPNLHSVVAESLKTPVDPKILQSNKWKGKFQVQCTGCNRLVDKPFSTRDEARKWFWNVHVLEGSGHRAA